MPISISEGLNKNDKDSSGRSGFNGIFGDKFVTNRRSVISTNFFYSPNPDTSVIYQENGGTVGRGVGEQTNLMVINSGSDPNGRAYVQSKRRIPYSSSKDAMAMFSAIYESKPDNITLSGAIDDNDGFAICSKDGVFGVLVRNRGVEIFIPQSEFNSDKVDGSGKSGFELNPHNLNLYRINYGYLGIAPTYFEVEGQRGQWILMHVYDLINTGQITHISNPYLPLRAEVKNYGNTDPVPFKSASTMGGKAGEEFEAPVNDSSREFALSRDTAITAGTNIPILTIHSKSNFDGLTNYIESLLLSVKASSEGNKPVVINLYKLSNMPALTVFQNTNAISSVIEYSEVGTVNLNNSSLLYSLRLGKSESQNEKVYYENLRLLPDEYIVFTASSTGSSEVGLSIRWSEKF